MSRGDHGTSYASSMHQIKRLSGRGESSLGFVKGILCTRLSNYVFLCVAACGLRKKIDMEQNNL